MNEWSRTRKRIVFSIVFLSLAILIGVPVFLMFYRAPTCFDKSQNGQETGVDCGGVCQRLCVAESLPLILKGDPRVLKVKDNLFEVVVLVENPNLVGEIYKASYTFKLYDASSTIPVKIIEGATFVPKNTTFALLEGPFSLEGGATPSRATIELKQDKFEWQKNNEPEPEIVLKETRLTRTDTTPRLDTLVENKSLENLSNIDLTAVISDRAGNIFASSKTFIDTLAPGRSASAVFTWPEPFKDIEKEEICGYPVDVVLSIDRSGSMDDLGANPPQPLTDVKNTALSFVRQLGKNDRSALVSFANEASSPIDASLGATVLDMERAITNIRIATTTAQNTNIGSGILSARQELNSARGRGEADKVIVLLTDGVPTLPEKSGSPEYPKTFALESARLAKEDGISVYTIGLGKDIDSSLLKAMATTTTEAYFAPSAKDLNTIYKQIATKICKTNFTEIEIYVRVFPDRSFLR